MATRTRTRADMALALVEQHRAEVFLSSQDHKAHAVVGKGEFEYDYVLESQLFSDLLIGWMDEAHRVTVPKTAIDQVVATLTARARRAWGQSLDLLRERFRAVGDSALLDDLFKALPGVSPRSLFHAARYLRHESILIGAEEREGKAHLVRQEMPKEDPVYRGAR